MRASLSEAIMVQTKRVPRKSVRTKRAKTLKGTLTRQQFERMFFQGLFGDNERLELVDGEVVALPPEGSEHSNVIDRLAHALEEAFGPGFFARIQHPLAIAPDAFQSDPEPGI